MKKDKEYISEPRRLSPPGEKQYHVSVEVWEVHLSQDQLGPIPK